MISFLNSALFWGLPLAAAPVILHLFFLRRARRMPFSDLTLLREAYLRSLPSSRLRQWLLMLVRGLMIAGLFAAFARPVLHRTASAVSGSEQGLDLVVLADTSWSMGALTRGKSRLEWGIFAVSELIRSLHAGDRVAVAAFSNRLESDLSWMPNPAAAAESLARLRVGVRRSDIAPILSAACRFLAGASRKRRRAILVLSDNAAHLFGSLPEAGVPALRGFDPRVVLLGLRWPEKIDNAQVAHLRLESQAEEGVYLSAQMAVYGPAQDTSAELWLRGRRVDQRSLRLEQGLNPSLPFHLPQTHESELWGRLQLRPDALGADDAYYYSLRVQPRPRILLLYGSSRALEAGKGGYFLKQLLGESHRLPYRFDASELGRLGQIRLDDYDAVILLDIRGLDAQAPAALERYVARGHGLWVIAGERVEEAAYRGLSRLIPGRLGLARQTSGRSLSFVAEPRGAPSAAGRSQFSWSDFDLKNILVARSYSLEPAPGSQVWFRNSQGAPLMAAGSFGSGRILVWASTLDLEWTNLGLKPAFTAWVDVALRHLTRYTGQHVWRASLVGEPIIRVWGPAEAAPAKVALRGPGGRQTVLLVRDRRVEYRDTEAPGLYFLSTLSGESQAPEEAYAVNLDRKGPEGDLAEPKRLPWMELRPQSLRGDFSRAVYGLEIRTWVLALVLLLFWMEMFLSRPKTA